MALAPPPPPLEIRQPDEAEVTALEELQELAEIYRDADVQEKAAKGLKDEIRTPFLELITEVVRDEGDLLRQVVDVSDAELEPFGHDVQKWRSHKYPEWKVVAIESYEGGMRIGLEEDDSFKKFEFVYGGFKYGRTLRMSGSTFESKSFLDAVTKTKLPAEVKKQLRDTVKVEKVVTYTFDEAKATKLMADQPETVSLFQDYIHPGTPSVALLPIKPVKEPEE